MTTIRSKDHIESICAPVGGEIRKDMRVNDNTDSLDADYAPNNVAIPGGQVASWWSDWGNDIFDGWGFFYIFNVATNEYYFPKFYIDNESNGRMITNRFNAFDRTFTIVHGYPVQGIYKFDVSVNDPNFQFIFGAYGDMGSDSSTENTNETQDYSLNGQDFTLYYNRNVEESDEVERFFSYFVPYEPSLNNTKTYSDFLTNDDELSLFSAPVRKGVTVYFSKQNDVKDWIINDLFLAIGRNGRQMFNFSLQNCSGYDAYRFYQARAVKFGFPRMKYSDYIRIYQD